jgi:polar amino acid transport system permease protein
VERFLDSFVNLQVWARYWSVMWEGFWLTIWLAALVVVAGLVLGVVLALARVALGRAVQVSIIVFADVFRAIPPLAILVVLYFALPFVGVRMSGFAAAWLGLTLVVAAFIEEIVYGGIAATDQGQWLAARASGFGFAATLLIIILPQALRTTLAPITNRTIAISKNTALASVIAVPELLNKATSAQAASANTTPLTMAALLYLLMFLPLVVASRWVERKFPPRR